MDILSEVLNNVRLSGSVLFFAEYRTPWSIGCPPASEIAPLLVSGASDLVIFHIMIDGHCRLSAPGGASVTLDGGDAVLMAQGDAHVLTDGREGQPRPILDLLPPMPWDRLPYLVHGGEGPVARMLCGFLHCADARLSPFLASLPRVLRVAGDAGVQSSLRDVQRLLIAEARNERPGYSCVLSRLTETFFIEALRRHIATEGEASRTLAALRDPVVGGAVALMHAEPARRWSVPLLARELATSRSLLAARFTTLMGCAPMQYLARWRVLTAARRLQDGGRSIAEVGAEVGYESDAAFARAFKRHLGTPPATWRGRRRASAS
jgi:AraC-like DNA-binding protein